MQTVRTAVARGVFFELCYAGLLRDPGSRRQFISNATALTRATGGDALLMSSGAMHAFELRSPHDVANLGSLFGLTQAAAERAALGGAASAVLLHARRRVSEERLR